MIPTLFGIMLINFIIIQTAPGGPVEQAIADDRATFMAVSPDHPLAAACAAEDGAIAAFVVCCS